MLLTLYDKNYNQKMEIASSDSSTQQKEVQSDNVLSLSFSSFECVSFEVGDYIDFCGERFWVINHYTPKQISTVEWEYSVLLFGIESLIKQFLVINNTNGDYETEFSLTATAYDHVALIVGCINAGMGTSDWKVGEVVASEYITIDYEGIYCDEGLRSVAEKKGVEYWIDGTTVNVCRCEHSASITLGYGNGLTNVYKEKANNVKFFTRLFPIGTTRNIVNDDYGHSRLQLPNGVKYLDQDVDKFGVVHHYEKEAFAHIYPRRVGTISNVRSEEVTGEEGNPFTIYYFKDASLNFDPNDYEIGGLVKTISFQDGSDLSGRDFEVNFNSTTKEFEIITQWPYDNDIQLPNEQLCLKIGDKYILWNVKMPIEYYALAEAEYKTAVDEYMADQRKDVTVYKAHTDYIDIDERGLNLTLGQRVRLEHAEYFEDGYRDSRITKITRKVVRPTEMDIEISDVLSKGALEKVNDSITDVKNYTKIATGGFPNVIKSWDNTLPTDSNVFSARKALQESLSRQVDDVAKGLITFLKGIKLGDYVAGESGSAVDAGGNAEFQTAVIRELLRSTKFVDGMMGEGYKMWIDAITGLSNLTIDKVTIRQSLVAMELLIEKVRSVGGQFVVSAANGKIKNVVESGDNYIITFEQENTFEEHDLMRCATFSGDIKGYWVEVLESTANSITVPISEFEGGDPVVGDECVLMGNTENALRQNLILIAATEDGQSRIDILDGVNAKNFNGCMRVRLGALDGVNDPAFPLDNQPQGYGLYSDNVYLKGTFVLSTGEDILTRFSIVEGQVKSAVEGLKQDFTADKSFLDNATFGDGLTSWETENEAILFRFNSKWLWINGAPYSTKSDYAAIKQDDGRTTVFIKNNYILQRNENFRTIPTYTDTNSDGQKIAEAIYLLFFYRVKKAGRLTIEFDGLDQTGFEPFNAFSYLEDMEVTDGSYKTFNHSGLWNGTGDFKLSFTGEMNLYMLVLSTDKADALAWKYRTLFEQSEKLIKIATQNFDQDGNVLQESGILTSPEGNQMYAFDTEGNLCSLIDQTAGAIKIKAEHIDLSGVVTVNDKIKMNEDGSLEAIEGKFQGAIYMPFADLLSKFDTNFVNAITVDPVKYPNIDLLGHTLAPWHTIIYNPVDGLKVHIMCSPYITHSGVSNTLKVTGENRIVANDRLTEGGVDYMSFTSITYSQPTYFEMVGKQYVSMNPDYDGVAFQWTVIGDTSKLIME